MARRRLGRRFGLLWAAYAVSAYGSGLGFGALPLIAVLVLRAGPAEVAALSAAGPAVGALLAVPLAPWVEFRRKRPVMIVTDLVRCAALASVPVAYALGLLGPGQLFVVSATLSAARIASGAASGAYLKALLRPEDLLVANARFESTNWSSIAVGPPLGGAAIGVFGPVVTLVADALGHLLSALCLVAAGGREEAPPRPVAGGTAPAGGSTVPAGGSTVPAGGSTVPAGGSTVPAGGSTAPAGGTAPVEVTTPARSTAPAGALLDGWRHLLREPVLRALCLNNMAVSGLIMATEPVLAVLLLRDLGFPPWQYALAFAAPCLGGLVGSRLARRTVARHGRGRVIGVVGTLRAVWLIGLALVGPGTVELLTVMAVELAIIVHMSLYTPVLATLRLERTPRHLVARTLTAWSIAQQASIAVLTALGGLLAAATGPRTALVVVGLLALATPLLLPRSDRSGTSLARHRPARGPAS
ncbi:MFS transporter [Streptomyces sp. NPDC093249]|uniref:MFS transporter n=1 Tax=unclassified Streptomyces TaxID=2593676 RepID=UPI003830E667